MSEQYIVTIKGEKHNIKQKRQNPKLTKNIYFPKNPNFINFF